MALASVTITYDIADLVGVDFDSRRTKVWVTTNADSVIDTLGNQIRLGTGLGTVNADGTGSVSVWVPGTGSNPATWQTTVHIDYVYGKGQGVPGGERHEQIDFGPFTITAGGDLADLVEEQVAIPTAVASDYAAAAQASAEDADGFASAAASSAAGASAAIASGVTAAQTARTGAETARAGAEAAEDAAQALVLSDLGTTDGQTRALIENPASQVAVALDALYARLNPSAYPANLTPPYYFAHRFGAGYAPEETMEAARISVALGVEGLEADCQTLADGADALMHDDTVTRTTDGTGNVGDYTAASWRALNAAAKFPWNGKVLPPALMTEALTEFGGKRVLMLEPKDSTNAVFVMDRCDAFGVTPYVIIATQSTTILSAAKARGFLVYYYRLSALSSAQITAFQTAASLGADFIGWDGGSSNATVSDPFVTSGLVPLGLPLVPFTIDRRHRRDALLALGADGFLSNQPPYLKSTTAQRKVDSWRQGVYGHGLISAALANQSSVIATITGGVLSLGDDPAQTTGYNYAMVGEVSPIANRASTYSIDIDMGMDSLLTTTTQALTLGIGMADDANFKNVAGSYVQGYAPYLIPYTGDLRLYRLDNSTTAVQFGVGVITTPMTAGTFAHARVDVTPTTITVTRTDVPVATLSAGLTSGVAVTSLPINALGIAQASGAQVMLSTGQVATLTAAASAGATSLTVASITPTSAVASASALNGCVRGTDSAYRGGYLHVGKRLAAGKAGLFKNLTITP